MGCDSCLPCKPHRSPSMVRRGRGTQACCATSLWDLNRLNRHTEGRAPNLRKFPLQSGIPSSRLTPAILWPRFAFFAASLLLASACLAAEPEQTEAPQRVEVSAHEQPMEEKSYRDLLAAMKRFEGYRALHPEANLRFRIYQRKEGVDFSQLRVWILDPDDRSHVDLDIASDGSFTVPVLEAQRQHDAIVRTNMPDGMLTWMVEVRRGDDDNRHHLLGDLREACLLDVDYAHLGRTFKPPVFYVLDAVPGNVCLLRGIGWAQVADKPVFSVHLSAGDRNASLLSDRIHGTKLSPFCPIADSCYLLRDRMYSSPLNDSSWPDETSVDVIYTDDPEDAPATRTAPQAPTSTAFPS